MFILKPGVRSIRSHFLSTLILLSRLKLTHFLTHEVVFILIREHLRLSVLPKAENYDRPSKPEPRDPMPVLHMVPGFDAEVDGRHLKHFDRQYGSETVKAIGVDGDAALR